MDTPSLNVAQTLERSSVNGPGERFVVWVQGCSLRCPGCWNPDTWSARRRRVVSCEALAQQISETPGIEGVSLTGGEPFEQAASLAWLARQVRARGLSVVAFSGYSLRELTSADQRALVDCCDVLIAGRYVAARRSTALRWRGSSNQRVHFLSERYSEADFSEAGEFEVHITAEGVTLTGFPPAELISARMLRD